MQTHATDIQPGWDAIGADDQKIGTIQDVGTNYLLIEKGLIFVNDIYVPSRAVTSIDANKGCVYLNVGKDDVDAQGWTSPPEDTDVWEGWSARQSTGQSQTTAESVRSGLASSDRTMSDPTTSDRTTMPLREEELNARKSVEDVGNVSVGKRVVEEEQTISVPVMREEVEVRRTPVDRPADSDAAFGEDRVDVPVQAERVEVTKTPRVVEEVEISKVPREEQQNVTGTVRREEADIEGSGDSVVRDASSERSSSTDL